MNDFITSNKRTEIIKTSDVRQSFLDYFVHRGHKLVPSSPVIPHDDPTLLFTNAGMNQFKDVFTGRRVVDYNRATSSQKCMRAGGKHNDLDNVGFTARHHTFFEILGNFSFGDYFKEEAISYAWELVTKVWKLPVDRLYATVYDDDDEAFELWEKIAPELKNGRILRFGKSDNYWSMGDVGPCGPCSEIHIDRGAQFGTGPNDVVNGETDRFMEIWNLVFMQFDQLPDGTVSPLPKPSVDTGAGLERIAAVMQGVDSNYGIDLFQRLIGAVSEVTGARYQDHIASHQVVADHIRALTFALADGAGISNEGRGYVLRRILRRAARHGRLLGAHEPFMFKLVPALVDEMGEAFPEIGEKQEHVQKVIQAEEENFLRTLETGLDLFDKVARQVKEFGQTIVGGEDIFRLYDTYGFPYDLTEIIAGEQGLTLDRAGFELSMAEQQERSREASAMTADVSVIPADWTDMPQTEFVRSTLATEAEVLRVHAFESDSTRRNEALLVLSKTPFYTESGGQVSDQGVIRSKESVFQVEVMLSHQGASIHQGRVTRGSLDEFKIGSKVQTEVDANRRWDIMRNHTATHLLHAALRRVLGDHVKQSGSLVSDDHLRFDFSHHQPMTADEIAEVERLVNNEILKGHDVGTEEMDIGQAKAVGAMALFGEKYADRVRVVSVNQFSKELCGGTHVQNVSQIGPFLITLETGVASGVRRVVAITGREATAIMLTAKQFRSKAAALVNRPEADTLEALEQLKRQNAELQKELKKARAAMFSGGTLVGEEMQIGPIYFVAHDFGDTDRETMSAWVDSQQSSSKPVIAAGMGMVAGKETVMIAASGGSVKNYHWHCGDAARELLSQFGGRGGGKPNFAQGSVVAGTEAERLFRALEGLIRSQVNHG